MVVLAAMVKQTMRLSETPVAVIALISRRSMVSLTIAPCRRERASRLVVQRLMRVSTSSPMCIWRLKPLAVCRMAPVVRSHEHQGDGGGADVDGDADGGQGGGSCGGTGPASRMGGAPMMA